jgi:NADH-ubiquinone oxidoreductase chain 6
MLSGMTFVGIAYLLVYIGAVSILFLFILMLINVRISELQGNTNNSLPLALIIGVFFYYFLYKLLPLNNSNKVNEFVNIIFPNESENIYVTSNV